MASILTLYCNNPQQSGSSAGLLDPTQPGASTSTTGWTVGTISLSFPYSRTTFGVEKPSNGFGSAVQPNSGPITTNGQWACDCWRISAATTGDFSAGTWYSSLSVIAVSSGGDQDGN